MHFTKALRIMIAILLIVLLGEATYLFILSRKSNPFQSCSNIDSCRLKPNNPLLGKDQKEWILSDVLPAYEYAEKNNSQSLYIVNEWRGSIGKIEPAKTSKGAEAIKISFVDEAGKEISTIQTALTNFGEKIKLYKRQDNDLTPILVDDLKTGQKIELKVQDDLLDRSKSTTEIIVYD